tara:strand:+ start:3525 stop:3755 length:231 start_codon:yes stop_codon:yes gene_type:complete
MKNGNMPITPIFDDQGAVRSLIDEQGFSEHATGLTKREYFAGLAMQALTPYQDLSIDEVALRAVEQADALLKKLEE